MSGRPMTAAMLMMIIIIVIDWKKYEVGEAGGTHTYVYTRTYILTEFWWGNQRNLEYYA